MRKLRDDAYCARMVDAAYEMAMSELTYDRLISRLADLMTDIV